MFRSALLAVFVTAFAAFVLNSLMKFGFFERVYSHRPGKCHIYSLNGSEDMALFPNHHVLISSGLYFWETEGTFDKPIAKIYAFDLRSPSQGPMELIIDPDFINHNDQFNPHGIGHWVTEDGEFLLYVVNHFKEKDTVECFQYDVERRFLKHRRSFQHSLLRNLNDIVIVGLDEFYTTVDHYFSIPLAQKVESLLTLPLCSVIYYNAKSQDVEVAAQGLKYANGIAMSTNKRNIYVSNIGSGEVIVYARNDDNALQYIQAHALHAPMDNIFIDPDTGHMWVATLPVPLHVLHYMHHDRAYPVEGRILHLATDENQAAPFSSGHVPIEEAFATDGTDFGPTTIAVYFREQLLIGTIASDMMYCEDVHTMF